MLESKLTWGSFCRTGRHPKNTRGLFKKTFANIFNCYKRTMCKERVKMSSVGNRWGKGIDNRQHYVGIKKLKNGFRGKESWWTICRTVMLHICSHICLHIWTHMWWAKSEKTGSGWLVRACDFTWVSGWPARSGVHRPVTGNTQNWIGLICSLPFPNLLITPQGILLLQQS